MSASSTPRPAPGQDIDRTAMADKRALQQQVRAVIQRSLEAPNPRRSRRE